jgi:hypothetical protein
MSTRRVGRVSRSTTGEGLGEACRGLGLGFRLRPPHRRRPAPHRPQRLTIPYIPTPLTALLLIAALLLLLLPIAAPPSALSGTDLERCELGGWEQLRSVLAQARNQRHNVARDSTFRGWLVPAAAAQRAGERDGAGRVPATRAGQPVMLGMVFSYPCGRYPFIRLPTSCLQPLPAVLGSSLPLPRQVAVALAVAGGPSHSFRTSAFSLLLCTRLVSLSTPLPSPPGGCGAGGGGGGAGLRAPRPALGERAGGGR